MSGKLKLQFTLHPRQMDVLESEANEILFGGALQAGKSFLARIIALTYCAAIESLQCWVFRRTFAELEGTFWFGPDSLAVMAGPLIKGGLCRTVGLDLEFANGARIHCTHFESEGDASKLEGSEIHLGIIDEVTHFSARQYAAIRRRLRLGSLALPEKYRGKFPMLFCTGTPGGVGHSWVREYFIDSAPAGEIRDVGGMKRQFVAARIDDNPSALRNDPSYVEKLRAEADPAITLAKLYGDWNVVSGSMFAPPFSRERHVVRPFPIPVGWKIVRGCDDGFAAPLSCHWIATDPVYLRNYVIGELYQEGLLPTEAAREILDRDRTIQREDAYGELSPNRESVCGVIDSSSFDDHGSGTPSRGKVMNSFGCKWTPCLKYPGSRVHGIQHIYARLSLQKDGWPGLIIFDSCPVLIKALSGAPRDLSNPEDIMDGYEYMHAIDSLRYALGVKEKSFRRVGVSGI
jgi:hypothetical protein